MVGTIQRGVYEKLGVRRIINGVGLVTRLGGSVMPPEVVEAMAEASRSYVDLDELQRKAGEVIARCTGAEAGYVCAGGRRASPGHRGLRRRYGSGKDPSAAGYNGHEERSHAVAMMTLELGDAEIVARRLREQFAK